jgi:hypothetical protein
MSSLHVKGCTKSWEAQKHDDEFRENESTDIRNSERLRKGGNARINKVLAMRAGLAQIFDNVHISTYVENAETDVDIGEKTCCIHYGDTWLSK